MLSDVTARGARLSALERIPRLGSAHRKTRVAGARQRGGTSAHLDLAAYIASGKPLLESNTWCLLLQQLDDVDHLVAEIVEVVPQNAAHVSLEQAFRILF